MAWNSKRDAKYTIYYVDMNGVRVAYRRKKDSLKNLLTDLGVKQASDTTDNLVFGISKGQRPPQVRINCAGGKSYIVYADPSKLESLIYKGSINGKKYDNKEINSVTMVHD